MVFEHIEKLKSEFTDKLVVVDKNRAELRRFIGQTGIVRTVNMSGRALVEFDAYDNIAWYDIDVDFLKIIDAPLPKPEKPAAAAKPKAVAAAKPKSAPSAPAAKGGGMSVAEMLAAARGEKGAGQPAAKPAAGSPSQMSVAEMLAAARGEKSGAATGPGKPADKPKPAAKPKPQSKPASGSGDPRKLSVQEMLAAARGEKSAAAAAAGPSDAEAPQSAEPPAPSADTAPAAESTSPPPAAAGRLPTDPDAIVAWCRQRDG